MDQKIKNRFLALLGEQNVLTDEPMSNHTTFRIGGARRLLPAANRGNADKRNF